MARETAYIVQAFDAGKGGRLKPDSPIACKSATVALRLGSQAEVICSAGHVRSTPGSGRCDDHRSSQLRANSRRRMPRAPDRGDALAVAHHDRGKPAAMAMVRRAFGAVSRNSRALISRNDTRRRCASSHSTSRTQRRLCRSVI